MKLNEDGKTVAAMDCLVPGIMRLLVVAKEKKTWLFFKKQNEGIRS